MPSRAQVLRAGALALAALACACDDPPPPAPAAPYAPYAPPRSIYDPPAPYLPDLPAIEETACPLPGPPPAHVLLLTFTALRLDDRDLDLAALPAALADVPELALAIDPDLPYQKVLPVLTALPPDLRLFVALRIRRDPPVRHLPISARYGPGPARTAPLPPRSYAVHLADPPPAAPSLDPLATPFDLPANAAGVRVSADPTIPWSRVTAALAASCTGATLVDPPAPRPSGPLDLPPAVRSATARVAGADAPTAVQGMLDVHVRTDVPRCYARLLLRDPRARGVVDLSLTLTPDGTVTAATIDRSTLPDPDIATCLANTALRWNFGRSAAPADTTVALSFAR